MDGRTPGRWPPPLNNNERVVQPAGQCTRAVVYVVMVVAKTMDGFGVLRRRPL
jgi:hypothetical protein